MRNENPLSTREILYGSLGAMLGISIGFLSGFVLVSRGLWPWEGWSHSDYSGIPMLAGWCGGIFGAVLFSLLGWLLGTAIAGSKETGRSPRCYKEVGLFLAMKESTLRSVTLQSHKALEQNPCRYL